MSEMVSNGGSTVLTELAEGERARVEQRRVGPLEAELLAALGLREGSELRVCRAGDPCIVEVRSARIGMTRRIAEQLAVCRVGIDRQ
jgi:Fe2+ transport system protein FeoA